MVDKAISTYINEMIKHTLKVYTLSVALCERDPSSAYESIHESLEKVTLFRIRCIDWAKQLIQLVLGEASSYSSIVSTED